MALLVRVRPSEEELVLVAPSDRVRVVRDLVAPALALWLSREALIPLRLELQLLEALAAAVVASAEARHFHRLHHSGPLGGK